MVDTSGNERHPSLVQTGDNAWSLFHVSNASGQFRIHRATSSDGIHFSASSPINLGWGVGEINPHVIRRDDGTLVLTYHRLSGAAYIALSQDDGATWDTRLTKVSEGNAALPRLTWRASDGRYLLVYQTGSSPVTLWLKTSNDPYDWSDPPRQFTLVDNDHDAFPVVLHDDSFALLWGRYVNSGFQLFSSHSRDGEAWLPAVQHTDRFGLSNVQPYALRGPVSGTVELYWGAAQVPGDSDYDIVREASVMVADTVFADDFGTSP